MRLTLPPRLPLLFALATTQACLDWKQSDRPAEREDSGFPDQPDASPDDPDGGSPEVLEDAEVTSADPDDADLADSSVELDAGAPVTDADLPELDALTPEVDAGPQACPADACPEVFPCEGSADDFVCRGQFAEFPLPSRRAGQSLAAQQFEVNRTEGTVLDRVTGLMWQHAFLGTPLTHAESLEYCAGLSIGGYHDYRVPSVQEFVTLFGAEVGPELDSTIFFGVSGTFSYWTSTPNTESEYEAYFSLFFMEYSLSSYAANDYRGSLCVRTHTQMAHGTPARRFVVEPDPTFVRDTHTGLVWERDLPLANTSLTFAQATAHCGRLTSGGRSFRLPSIAEAVSARDYSKPTGLRVPAPFTGRNSAVWTRTQAAHNVERGTFDRWVVGAGGWLGISSTDDTTFSGVRCVAVP